VKIYKTINPNFKKEDNNFIKPLSNSQVKSFVRKDSFRNCSFFSYPTGKFAVTMRILSLVFMLENTDRELIA